MIILKIRTTINIRNDLLERLETASISLKMPKTAVISALLKHLMEMNRLQITSWTGVKYQRRLTDVIWKKVHVSPRADEYEFFLDSRKVCKMSVSFLIAYAIENYLDILMKLIVGDTDNYRYHNYAMTPIIIDDIVCWLFCWGIPPGIIKNR